MASGIWYKLVCFTAVFWSIEAAKKADGDFSHLVRDCGVNFYSDGGVVNVESTSSKSFPKVWEQKGEFNLSFSPKPECLSNTNESKALKLVYKAENDAQVTVSVEFNFMLKNSEWGVTNLSSKIEGVKNAEATIESVYSTKYLRASRQFSYSCMDLSLQSKVKSSDLYRVSLSYKRFQVQPFDARNNKSVFEESTDCSAWFTIPMWMGFFTVTLLTSILAMGVYMLVDIKTMDRFENPKGKTITISATD